MSRGEGLGTYPRDGAELRAGQPAHAWRPARPTPVAGTIITGRSAWVSTPRDTLPSCLWSLRPSGASSQHEQRTTGGARELPRGAPMNQATDWPVATGADDEEIEGGAVHREFLGGIAVRGVWLDVAESRDPVAGLIDERVDRGAQ